MGDRANSQAARYMLIPRLKQARLWLLNSLYNGLVRIVIRLSAWHRKRHGGWLLFPLVAVLTVLGLLDDHVQYPWYGEGLDREETPLRCPQEPSTREEAVAEGD